MRNFSTWNRRIWALLAAVVLLVTAIQWPAMQASAENGNETVYVKIKYVRADGEYGNPDIWVWSDAMEGHAERFTGQDSEGLYTIIETRRNDNLGFIIRCTADSWDDKFVADDIIPDFSNGNVEYVASVDAEGNRTLETRTPATAFDRVAMTLHYYRFDGDYSNWDIWAWASEGNGYPFTGEDNYGVYGEADLGAVDADTEIGFIVRRPDWSEKDWDGDRFVDKFFINADGLVDVYVISGQQQFYYSEAAAQAAVDSLNNPRVTSAAIDSLTEVTFQVNNAVTLAENNANIHITANDGTEVSISQVTLAADSMSGTILLEQPLDLNRVYTLSIDGYQGKELTFGNVFNSDAFEALYTYTGDLGAIYSKDSTTFVLWAPTASAVQLALYGTNGLDYTGSASQILDLQRSANGSWTTTVDGDLNGTYYNYLVTVDGSTNEVVDPYAKAVGVNGNRGMVIDLDTTDPEGWESDEKPLLESATDAIIYEMHIRDFSISETSGISIEYQGKFNGVWQSGTTIPGTDISTGVDHLKELGVNVVHLLPSFDYATVDETKLDTPQFNWGYDPKNYNAPEGSYSSDPYTAQIRIEEFKKMVMELHKAGIRVVMDVVYNHTGATTDSNLNLAVPNYYYRQNAAGGFSNGSGCGNETASERSMVGRLISDSVAYWAEEYHIDGFRFDLMAVHDIDTMISIRERLNAIDPSILMYGEGWTGGDCALDPSLQATKANTVKFGDLQIAAFSDDIRDGIKGHVFNLLGTGFVNGGSGYEETIQFGIVASTPNEQVDSSLVMNQTQPWANQPYQTITYASAHDNLTLWDKLNTSNAGTSEEELLAMNKMSAAIVYTSQGIPFMLSGEEMARTKTNEDGSLNENSYNAPDSVNAIDWTRKVTYHDLYEYYKGLISLRKAHKAFHMDSTADIQSSIQFLETPERVVAYTLDGTAAADEWETIAVVFNANTEAAQVTIPEGTWVLVVNGEKAGVEELGRMEGGSISVPGQTSYVLVDADSFDGELEDVPSPGTGDPFGIWVSCAVAALALGGAVLLLRKRAAR